MRLKMFDDFFHKDLHVLIASQRLARGMCYFLFWIFKDIDRINFFGVNFRNHLNNFILKQGTMMALFFSTPLRIIFTHCLTGIAFIFWSVPATFPNSVLTGPGVTVNTLIGMFCVFSS